MPLFLRRLVVRLNWSDSFFAGHSSLRFWATERAMWRESFRRAAVPMGISTFTNYLRRLLIIAHGDEGAMTQVPSIPPTLQGWTAHHL